MGSYSVMAMYNMFFLLEVILERNLFFWAVVV